MTLGINMGRNCPSSDEGLWERVSEVEMFAGCLKEDGIDAVLAMEGRALRN